MGYARGTFPGTSPYVIRQSVINHSKMADEEEDDDHLPHISDEDIVEEIRAQFKVSIIGTTEGMKETILILDHSDCWESLPEEYFVEAVRQSSRGFPVSVLVMKHHRLQALPTDLHVVCSRLNHMDLSFNRLPTFSLHAPSAFSHLKELILTGNGLLTIEEDIGELRQLQLLDLSQNKLIALPPALGRLQNLTVLRAAFNRITSLCDEVCSLKNLRELEIHNNLLASIPPSFSELTQLQILHASCNSLSNQSLTTIVTCGANLQELYMANNCITALPLQLSEQCKLKRLVIGGNPIVRPPLRVCRKGLGAIQQYLTKKLEKVAAEMTVSAESDKTGDERRATIPVNDYSDDDSDSDYYVKLD